MPAAVRSDAARAAANAFAAQPCFKESTHIACYLANQEELDTQPLIEAVWRAKKICYLPVLQEGKSLFFARYDEGDKLRANQYGILEPENRTRKITAEKLEIVLVPLVAFDLMGHRIGTGGGYYDRTFAFLHAEGVRNPALFGHAYSAQQAADLPFDPWDVALSGVVTEKGVYKVSAQYLPQ